MKNPNLGNLVTVSLKNILNMESMYLGVPNVYKVVLFCRCVMSFPASTEFELDLQVK